MSRGPHFTLEQLSPALRAEAERQLVPSALSLALQARSAQGVPVDTPKPSKPRKTKGKAARSPRVERTRNGGTWTEAKYWGWVRSALRRAFRFWVPAQRALKAAHIAGTKRPALYLCTDCKKAFPRKEVEIDHVVPVGRLASLEDVAGFLARLTPEDSNAFACRCTSCHLQKTQQQRKERDAA